MAKDKDLTSWGDKPGTPIEKRRITRRDAIKSAGKVAIGVIAVADSGTGMGFSRTRGRTPDMHIYHDTDD